MSPSPSAPSPPFSSPLPSTLKRHWHAWSSLLWLVCIAPLSAQSIVQDYYVPMPEAQIRSSFLTLASGTGNTLDSVVSVVVGTAGSRVIYDHWEDGYEIDINHPAQSTTRIWGDGNDGNGVPPGYANDPDGLTAGSVIALRNLVSLPRNPSSVLYDGRDRIGATKGIVVSRSAWATNPGPVLADATEVSSTIDWGSSFVMPIGEDEIYPAPAGNSMFEVVSLFVQAGQNGTTVQIDADASGSAETTLTLNQGESYYLNRGVRKGATIVASKPVQVHLLTGDIGANYESRWFNIPPTELWGDSYFSPVGTATNGQETFVFLYNPDVADITVNYRTRVGTGSFIVPAKNTYRYQMPQDSGAHFYSNLAKPFFAIGTVGAKPSSNNVYDWGFSLVSEANLTTMAIVGWGPGSSDLSQNGSPAWVTTVAPTRIYVDYQGDKSGPLTDPDGDSYDAHYDVTALAVTRLYDPSKDQTGMRIYTLDGTLLTAAWGQDPAVAGSGNPFLDVGTTVPAFPVPVIRKTTQIINDVPPLGATIGDTLEYTITMDNHSLVALGNVLVLDGLPPQLHYLSGTTTRDGTLIADSADPTTPFPLDEGGILVPILPRGQTTVIKYQTNIVGTGEIINNVATSYNGVKATSQIPASAGGTTCSITFSTNSGTPVTVYGAGDGIYVSLNEPDLNTNADAVETLGALVRNNTNDDYEFTVLTETGPNTGLFRNASTLPSSQTNGLGPEDGTLNVAPGDEIAVSHVDAVNGETCSALATIAVPSLIKQLYLTPDGADNDLSGSLDRIDPVVTLDNSTSQTAVISSGLQTITHASSTSNSATNPFSSVTVSHTTGTGSNRLMLVGITYEDDNTSGMSVSGVTYAGNALSFVGRRTSSQEAVSEIWSLINPPSGTADVVVSVSGASTGDSLLVGASTFTGVHQTAPLGTFSSNSGTNSSPTVTVAAATGDLIYDVIAADDGRTATVGSGQTQRWNARTESGEDGVRGASSTEAGAASVTMSWSLNVSDAWAICAVPIKPAPTTVTASFIQTPAMAEDLVLPVGGLLGAEAWFTVTSGSMPASPAITARLLNGATPIASSTGASAAGGKLTFSFAALPGYATIPAGQAITLEINNTQSGVSYRLQYDSQTQPSFISLPTTTVIHIDSIAAYDAPYPAGNIVTSGFNGQTLYLRTVVGDPFGAYDITSLPLSIDGPGTSDDINITLTDTSVVASSAATKTYEYAWQTGGADGNYTIAATAKEGFENTIADQKSTLVSLDYLDLGTPSSAVFSKDSYNPDETVCVTITDLDQNLNATVVETIPAVITTSSGDSEAVSLTETGVNTGIFNLCLPASATNPSSANDGELHAPQGTVLVVDYIDPDDSTDASSDTSSVPLAPGTPGVLISKTLLAPADGQAMVGELVQYRLRVTNTGTTTLGSVQVTDNFPALNLAYSTATPAPTSTAAGLLTWNNIGSMAPGQTLDVLVWFTALASANPATNSASADAGGGVSSTTLADVVITSPAVQVTKMLVSPDPGPAGKGDDVVFSITVQNTGDTAITELPLEDTFSGAVFEYVSATPPPDATGSGSLLWLDITGAGSLAPAQSLHFTVTLRVLGAANPAVNLASVDFGQDVFGDPVPPTSDNATIVTDAASISGTVFEDRGPSGFDGSDVPLAGVTVRLYTDPNGDGNPADGVVVGVTTTQANGTYEFLNLALGDYVVVETDPIGYNSVADTAGANDNRIPVSLTSFGNSGGHNFLDLFIDPADYGNITGQVRNDTDADGDLSDSESGIAGVAIELYTDPNGDGDLSDGVLFAGTTTNGSGVYSFNLIPPGSYVVREIDPAGYVSTADVSNPNDNRIPASVAAGDTSSGNDFLDTNNLAALAAMLGNQVWLDTNNNGLLDGGESGVSGVTMQLYRSGQSVGLEAPYRVTTTGAGGVYQFAYLPAGGYTLYLPASNFAAALAAAPLSSTVTNSGDDNTDGDDNGIQSASGAAVSSPLFNLSAGETDLTKDFGFVPNASLGSISGAVLADTTGDSVGDTGLQNILITLKDSDGGTVATAFTNASGAYTFSGLPPGSYTIEQDHPPGYASLSDTDGGNLDIIGDVTPVVVGAGAVITGQNFIESQFAVIRGSVRADFDGDSLPDTPLPGVLITLKDGDGNTVASTSTLGDGSYEFLDLLAGDYRIEQAQPAGYSSLSDVDGGDLNVIGDVALIVLLPGQELNNQDFLEALNGVIQGTVLADVNNDGTGDVPLANITISLLDSSNNPVATTTTDSSGFYEFADLAPGDYIVLQTVPAGYQAVSPASVAVTLPAGGFETADFVDEQLGSISGTVYAETLGGGPMAGVLVKLLDAGGNPALNESNDPITALTDSNGHYSFISLPPGSYQVRQTVPATHSAIADVDSGELTINGDVAPIALSAGEAVIEQDFVNAAVADLEVTKVVSNATPNVGEQIIFTLTATNHGPSDATGVTVTDVLPSGYTFVSADSPDFSGSTWSVGDLSEGDSETLILTVTVNSTGDTLNTATIEGNELDLDLSNNEDEADATPVAVTDLEITKAVSDATPNVGEQITFTLTATNHGPSDATGVTVTDVLPSGYTFVSADSPDFSGSTWSVGDLSEGDSETLILTVTVNSTGDTLNTATIEGNELDLDLSNNEDEADATPVAVTDLEITKAVSDATPNVGEQITFTLTATNHGPSDATGVTVTDVLPSGYTFVSADSPNFSGDTWTVGNLSEGDSETLVITVTVNATGDTLNSATVAGNELDPDLDNNDDEANTAPTPVTDLEITKDVSNATPNVGEQITFTLTATNHGPSDATGVTVTDVLPSGYIFVSADSPDFSGDTWSIGDLALNASETLVITVTVNASGATLNTATVAGNELDLDLSNNEDEADTTPAPVTDLEITKAVSDATPNVGEQITFTLTATNYGPSDATGVTVTDVLPSGYTFVSADSPDFSGSTWSIGDLSEGDSETLILTVTVNSTGDTLNTATITGNELDLNLSNNEDEADINAVPLGIISGTVTADTDNDDIGDVPLDNITITLLDSSNNPVATTTTDASGFYEFANLLAGDYTVVQTDLAGYQSITPNSVPATVLPDETTTVDFVDEQLGEIAGCVHEDLNGDGSGDQAIPGVTIELYTDPNADGDPADGVLFSSTTTDSFGIYRFENTPPGSYVIVQTQPSGFLDSSDADVTSDDPASPADAANGDPLDNRIPVTLAAGETDDGNDFIEVRPATLSGRVLADINGDSTGELPLSGVTLTLLNDLDDVVATTVTDGNGDYSFANLYPGTYRIVETQPAGYASVADADGGNPDVIGDVTPVLLAPDANSSGHDFIERAAPGYFYDVLSGLILSGGSVSVSGPGPVILTQDGSTGAYSFVLDPNNAVAGSYTITVTPPPGYILDPNRPVAGASFDPTGGPNPVVLGSGESGGALVDFSAGANPYYLVFDLAPGDPLVVHNNLPFVENKPKTWAGWRYRHPLGGENEAGDNPDGDRYDNLQEFAFCFNPETGVKSVCPIQVVTDPVTGRVDVRIRRVTGITGVQYVLEAITTLDASPAGWSDVTTIPPVITFNPGGTEWATYENVGALAPASTTGFFRVRVELDEDLNGSPEAITRTETVGAARRVFATQCETFSLPFLRCEVFGGQAGAVAGNVIDISAAAGTGDFAAALSAGVPYYVEVIDGDFEGHRFEVDEAASTATAIAIDTASPLNTSPSLPAGLSGGHVVVRPHHTLDQAFTKSLLAATNDPATADRVQFHHGSSFSTYWLFANGGNPRWVLAGDATLADRGSRIVAPGEGAFVRLKNNAVTMLWGGYVRSNDFVRPMPAGTRFVGGGWPLDQSPASSAMTTTNGFTGSNDPAVADKLQLWKGDATPDAIGYEGYFLLQGGAFNQWTSQQNAALVNQNHTTLLRSLRAVFILTRQSNNAHRMPMPWTP